MKTSYLTNPRERLERAVANSIAPKLANRKPGSPLPDHTRDSMERRFNEDFSGIRIHTDTEAAEMNDEIQADAFTHDQDIYFNQGQFNPESSSGGHLLAHELTHTIQQYKVK